MVALVVLLYHSIFLFFLLFILSVLLINFLTVHCCRMVTPFVFPIFSSFLKAKSEVSSADVKEIVEFGLEVFHASQNKLYAQVSMMLMALIYMGFN